MSGSTNDGEARPLQVKARVVVTRLACRRNNDFALVPIPRGSAPDRI